MRVVVAGMAPAPAATSRRATSAHPMSQEEPTRQEKADADGSAVFRLYTASSASQPSCILVLRGAR